MGPAIFFDPDSIESPSLNLTTYSITRNCSLQEIAHACDFSDHRISENLPVLCPDEKPSEYRTPKPSAQITRITPLMLELDNTNVSYSIPQTPQITNVVQRFWQVERHGAGSIRETIIPKGTVELIFNLQNSKIPGKIGTRDCVIPRCFISGFNTVPIQFQIADDQLFFGVFVKPIPIRKIFRIDTEEYANLCLDLTLVDKSIDVLWHQLNDQETFEQRVTVFTDWLIKRLPEISRHEQLFDDFLTSTPNRSTSAPELSRMLCYSPRHLSRKLHELTAMNLEQTLMYKRYIQALDLIHHSQLLLTEIAHACDFSDQSHFTKTFRSYAQMKPSEYRTVKSPVSGHIFENVL